MRKIFHIVIHHSASPLTTTASDIDKWHRDKGWSGAGYHLICESSGNMVLGREIGRVGAHCKGSNTNSIGICLVGNNTVEKERWTMNQVTALQEMLKSLKILFPLAVLRGHRDMPSASTECPGVDIRKVLGYSALV